MTVYELLCCFKSPNWCNYQNLFNPTHDFLPANVEKSLPETSIDSYLGRLINLAMTVNKSWDSVTSGTFDLFLQAISMFSSAGVLWGRPLSPKTKSRVIQYLNLGLPASWIRPMMSVFLLEFWSGEGPETSLNDMKFLTTLRELKESPYPPVQEWFRGHPWVTKEETLYKE